MSPQPHHSVLLLTWALCAADRAWGLICHVCIPLPQTGVETVTEVCLTAETEPYSLDPSCLLLHLMSQAAGKKGVVHDREWGGECGLVGTGEQGEWVIQGESVHSVRGKKSERRWIPGQRNGVCREVITVMQRSAKRGHVCAADSLVFEDINIL